MIIDLHSHILPGIDDGAKDWQDFLDMARLAVADGITTMVCTPHFIPGEKDLDIIKYTELLAQGKEKLAHHKINLELVAGCEVLITPDIIPYAKLNNLITIANNKYLLIEFSMVDIPDYTKDIFFELKLMGITPIIAHPERNKILAEDLSLVAELINLGALCQVNSGSILGIFGSKAKEGAIKLLTSGLIHLVGSDAHSARTRKPNIGQIIELLENIVGTERTKEITYHNQLKVLNGEEIQPYEIQIKSKLNLWQRLSKRVCTY